MVERTQDHRKRERAIDAQFYRKGDGFKLEDWDDLLREFHAVTDALACMFGDVLMEMYPEVSG